MHEAIRADPLAQKKERSTPDEKKKWKAAKLTYDERKAALKARPPAPAGSCCIVRPGVAALYSFIARQLPPHLSAWLSAALQSQSKLVWSAGTC